RASTSSLRARPCASCSASSVTRPAPSAPRSWRPSTTATVTTDVCVIGAGMAGVTAARDLERGGYDVVVLEARDRVGGRIHTDTEWCGAPVELGAEFIHTDQADTWPE